MRRCGISSSWRPLRHGPGVRPRSSSPAPPAWQNASSGCCRRGRRAACRERRWRRGPRTMFAAIFVRGPPPTVARKGSTRMPPLASSTSPGGVRPTSAAWWRVTATKPTAMIYLHGRRGSPRPARAGAIAGRSRATGSMAARQRRASERTPVAYGLSDARLPPVAARLNPPAGTTVGVIGLDTTRPKRSVTSRLAPVGFVVLSLVAAGWALWSERLSGPGHPRGGATALLSPPPPGDRTGRPARQ